MTTQPTPSANRNFQRIFCFIVAMIFCSVIYAFYAQMQLNHITQSLLAQSIDILNNVNDKLPSQKIVEVEKIIERPTKYSKIVEKALTQRKITYNKDALGFCKQLMYGRDGTSVGVSNLYEAISEWGTSPQANDGLEDHIMAHVMLVLIECFQNT